jgi:hypothetical protein
MPIDANQVPAPARRWTQCGLGLLRSPWTFVCVALVAVVFASRLWLAQAWGSALPFMDEWDLEAIGLYRPWLDGTLRLSDLFKPHNEHYLFLTRLVDLGFFVAFGHWEPWAQIVLNAVLHAATAATLAALFWPALTKHARAGFAAGLVLLFTSTCGWQNALLGIQSQVYFSNLFAVSALAGLVLAPPWSRVWWLGWVLAVMGLFCFAGGMLTALAAVTTGVVFRVSSSNPKRTWAAHALVAAVVASGLMLYVEPARQLPLHAQNVAQFYAVFSRCLGWPHVNSPWLWLVMQMPLVVLLVRHWFRRVPLDALDRYALALAIFAALQAAAVAHNRAGGLIDARPLSRYQDPLLLGVAANCFAVLRFAAASNRGARILALGWAAGGAMGLLTLTTTNLSFNLPYKRAQDTASIGQVRQYLSTADAGVFTRDPAYPGPHPNPQVLQQVLDDPILRPVLPAIFFSRESESAPGMKPWLIAQGRILFFLALVGFGGALAWALRRKS